MGQRGVSLIQVIITVIVMAILAGTVVFVGIDYQKKAQRKTLDMTLTNLRNEIELYKTMHGSYPLKSNPDKSLVKFDINSVYTLKDMLKGSADEGDTFYVIDLQKLNPSNSEIGMETSPDDVFIMARRTNNVYYAKGRYISDEEIYHGRPSKGSKLTVAGTVKFDAANESNFKEADPSQIEFADGYLQLHKN